MLTSLIIFGLIAAAVLYGIFFLIFKLIWILLKNKRNFWPLILAGVATLLIALLTVLATYRAYQTYAKPFSPIITAATHTKQPVLGTQIHTDTQYGFTIALQDGITLSDWIQVMPNNAAAVQVGIDINMFVQKIRKTNDFAGILIFHQTQPTSQTAGQLMQQALAQINQNTFPGRIELNGQPQEINVGTGATGAYVTGKIFTENVPQPLDSSLLIATRGNSCFFVMGIGAESAQQTVSSFHF